jgi:hypothetical protein
MQGKNTQKTVECLANPHNRVEKLWMKRLQTVFYGGLRSAIFLAYAWANRYNI